MEMPTTRALDFRSHDAVAELAFADSGYPRLTQALLRELLELLGEIQRGNLFCGVVIAPGATSFATGAAIDEVTTLGGASGRAFSALGQEVFEHIVSYPLPVVAAVRGFCLGGGFDLAMACHARVATYDACLGYPGGALGLITGWGGTQRLPRLIGKAAALQVFLTGERIPATQALTLGVVDELVPASDLVEAAVRRVLRLAGRHSHDSSTQ
jgi:enoyl-CoA hydratase/carnithine racemase